jgi:hypothetical protein
VLKINATYFVVFSYEIVVFFIAKSVVAAFSPIFYRLTTFFRLLLRAPSLAESPVLAAFLPYSRSRLSDLFLAQPPQRVPYQQTLR